MATKRVLIFSLAYYPLVGGAEAAIKEITDRVRDIQFDMVTMRFDRAHPSFEAFGNVHIHRVGNNGSYWNKILFIPRAALMAAKLNRKEKYDKFWAMMTYMLFPIALLRLFGNKTPYILTLQDGDPFEQVFKRLRIRVFLPLLKSGFQDASVIQAISSFLADWPRKMGYKGRVEVIPNGVDTVAFARPDFPAHGQEGKSRENPIELITTSRLVEKNGLADVIKALKLLPENIKFKILGVGPLSGSLRRLVDKEKLGSRVEFAGFVEMKDIPAHLHKADIFIRPSLSEGMGSSFIEAMAASLPVIATPVGGIPDFLSDPDKTPNKAPTGLYVAIHDPQGIAKQIQRLIKDDRLRETLINNAKRLVRERYNWNLIAEDMRRRVFNKI